MKRFRMTGNHWTLLLIVGILAIGVGEAAHRRFEQKKAREAEPIDPTHSPGDPPYLHKGAEAPDFTLPDAKGVQHKFSQLRQGKRTLLLSLCGCTRCRNFSRFLHQLETKSKVEKVKVIAVATFPPESEEAFRDDADFEGTILYDKPGKDHPAPVVSLLAGTPCPRAYVVDPEGKIQWYSQRGMVEMPMIGAMYAEEAGLKDHKLLDRILTAMQAEEMDDAAARAKEADQAEANAPSAARGK